MSKKKTISIYIDVRKNEWLEEMCLLNNRSKSYFVDLALGKLIEMTGGFGDELV